MRKTFTLNDEKLKVARQIEAAKSTINKYIKRERKKTLPDGVDFWDFECAFGYTKEEASSIHLSKLGKALDGAEADKVESFYVEIITVEGVRTKRPKQDS